MSESHKGPHEPHGHADEAMMPLADVQQLVLERCAPLQVVEVSVADSLGSVLAEDVIVGEDIPPFANSAMDGYAVRSVDVQDAPVVLEVVGVLAAGAHPPAKAITAGETMQIMTGAPVPGGADAIAIVERSERVDGASRVRIFEAVPSGAHVRPAGSDFASGSTALKAGDVIGPPHLAVLSSVGRTMVRTWRKPRVGVVSTGDELVEGAGPLLPGQIRESNRIALLALVREDGFEPVDLGLVRDDAAAVENALVAAVATCDAVLSSGGVSKGEFDYVKSVLRRMAAESGGEFYELAVAIRPAKPLALAWLPRPAGDGYRNTTFFGLPGNPVSSMVSYQVIARPALRQMAGLPDPLPATVTAVAASRLKPSQDGRLNLLRVEAQFGPDGRLGVQTAGGQQSHQLSGTTSANALALVQAGTEIEPGDEVQILLLTSVGR